MIAPDPVPGWAGPGAKLDARLRDHRGRTSGTPTLPAGSSQSRKTAGRSGTSVEFHR